MLFWRLFHIIFKLVEHTVLTISCVAFTLQSVEEQTKTTRRNSTEDEWICTTMRLSGAERDGGFAGSCVGATGAPRAGVTVRGVGGPAGFYSRPHMQEVSQLPHRPLHRHRINNVTSDWRYISLHTYVMFSLKFSNLKKYYVLGCDAV
jgi:hypothetical protein